MMSFGSKFPGSMLRVLPSGSPPIEDLNVQGAKLPCYLFLNRGTTAVGSGSD